MSGYSFDQDALIAATDLARRSGATGVEHGYLHDDVPVAEAGWYASASYPGARIIVENQPGPIEAADALARRILDGATCYHCKLLVSLSDVPGTCRWTRLGPHWKRGCEK